VTKEEFKVHDPRIEETNKSKKSNESLSVITKVIYQPWSLRPDGGECC